MTRQRPTTDVAIAKETLIKVKGRVTPKAAGQKVVLQQRVGNKKSWKATGTAKIKANGTYKLTDKPSTPGHARVPRAQAGLERPRRRASARRSRSRSTAGRSSPTARRSTTTFTSSGATIGTEYYGQSLTTITPGTAATTEYTPGPQVHRAAGDVRPHRRLGHRLERRHHGHRRRQARSPRTRSPWAPIVADEELDLTGVFRLKFDASTSATPAADRRRRHARGALHALTSTHIQSAAAGTTGSHRPGRARRCRFRHSSRPRGP